MRSPDLVFTLPVSDGKLQWREDQKRQLAEFCGRVTGRAVDVCIKRQVKHRSNSQNRFYWGCVLQEIANSTGHTTEDLHEVFKREFLPKQFVVIGDEEFEIAKSTTELTTTEFEQYIERIRVFASGFGVQIPLPGQAI